jgi:hypothetical protein
VEVEERFADRIGAPPPWPQSSPSRLVCLEEQLLPLLALKLLALCSTVPVVLLKPRGEFFVTSQLPVDQWHTFLADPTLADAILDRLVHNSYRLALKGDSIRKHKSLNSNPAPTGRSRGH